MRVCVRRGQSAIQALSLWPAGLGSRPSSPATSTISTFWPCCAAFATTMLRFNSSLTAFAMSDNSLLVEEAGQIWRSWKLQANPCTNERSQKPRRSLTLRALAQRASDTTAT